MKKSVRTFVSILIAAMMIAVALPFGAFAAEKTAVERIVVECVIPPYGGDTGRSYHKTDLKINYTKTLPCVRFSAGVADYHWIDSNGKVMTSEDVFETGKVYRMTMAFTLESEDSYEFTNDTVLEVTSVTGSRSKLELIENKGSRIIFRVHYTCRLRPGLGASEEKPVECYAFGDLKSALEDPDAVYVRLNDVAYKDDSDNFTSGDLNAITVSGKKVLEVAGDAAFQNSRTTSTMSFIIIPPEAELTVRGSGRIEYRAADHKDAALICNRGKLTVESGVTLSAFCRSYRNKNNAYAIIQRNVSTSELTVNGGCFHTINAADTKAVHSAVYVQGGKATVNYGFFTHNENDVMARNTECYGLYIEDRANAVINGGDFNGLWMPDNKSFISSGSHIDHNGSTFINGDLKLLRDGSTCVSRFLDEVSLFINEPLPGESPSDTVYVFTPGVSAIVYVWREDLTDAALEPGDTFKAGRSYSVEISLFPDPGYVFRSYEYDKKYTKFRLNNQPIVSVEVIPGFSEYTGQRIFLNSMYCPFIISEVALEIDPPVTGSKPSFSAKTGADCYTVNADNVDWYDVTAERFLEYDDRFIEGHEYNVQLWTGASLNYSFKVDDILDPDVEAKVNGGGAEVIRAYEHSADEMICVIKRFGKCAPSAVDRLDAVNAIPAVNGYPRYDVQNDDYRVTATLYAHLRDGKNMPKDEAYDHGHTYTIQVAFTANKGFTIVSGAKATINGLEAKYVKKAGNANVYEVSYSFAGTGTTVPDVGGGDPIPGELRGDVNNDGRISATDYAMAKRQVLKTFNLDEGQFRRADVDKDGKVSAKDYAMIKRHVLKTFTIPQD